MESAVNADEELVARWQKTLLTLADHVLELYCDRRMTRELVAGIQEATPKAPDGWLRHYLRLYAHSQAIGIRRIVRGTRKTIALTSLLGDMIDNAAVLTAERHIRLYKTDLHESMRRHGEGQFEAAWGDGSGQVAPEKLRAGLSGLMQNLNGVLGWADEVVAHIPLEDKDHHLTFADIHNAVDTVGDAFNNLSVLLTASTWSFEPHFAFDWKAPFRGAVFKPIGEDPLA
jgi:hypothetical protein